MTFSRIIQDFSNSMIFTCMKLFFSDFSGFPWFPELVGTLSNQHQPANLSATEYIVNTQFPWVHLLSWFFCILFLLFFFNTRHMCIGLVWRTIIRLRLVFSPVSNHRVPISIHVGKIFQLCEQCCSFSQSILQNTQIYEPWHEISNNVVCATSKALDHPAHTGSLIRAFASGLHIL